MYFGNIKSAFPVEPIDGCLKHDKNEVLVVVFFLPILQRADPDRVQNMSLGIPSSKNFVVRPEGYSNKPIV